MMRECPECGRKARFLSVCPWCGTFCFGFVPSLFFIVCAVFAVLSLFLPLLGACAQTFVLRAALFTVPIAVSFRLASESGGTSDLLCFVLPAAAASVAVMAAERYFPCIIDSARHHGQWFFATVCVCLFVSLGKDPLYSWGGLAARLFAVWALPVAAVFAAATYILVLKAAGARAAAVSLCFAFACASNFARRPALTSCLAGVVWVLTLQITACTAGEGAALMCGICGGAASSAVWNRAW